MRFYQEPEIGNPEFGVFFFGFFYLIYRGLWLHALIMILLALPTFGLIWIWYIFKTRKYLAKKLYLEGEFGQNSYDPILSVKVVNNVQ